MVQNNRQKMYQMMKDESSYTREIAWVDYEVAVVLIKVHDFM